MSNVKEQLQILTQNFTSLCESHKDIDKQKINSILDELNALNLKHFVVTDCNVVLSLLRMICTVITTSESFLISKSCKLLSRLLKNLQLPPLRCSTTCRFLMKALEDCNISVWEDILQTFYVILKTNAAYVSDLYDDLLGEYGMLYNFLDSGEANNITKINIENPHYIELGALKCIQALTLHCDSSLSNSGKSLNVDQHLIKCTKVAIFYLYRKKHRNQDEINFCETLICAFNILMQIFSSNSNTDKCLGESIGACRCWMTYALDGSHTNVAPQKAMPSQHTVIDVPQQQTNRGGKRMKLRKHRQSKPINNWRDDGAKETEMLDKSVDVETQAGSYNPVNAITTQLDSIKLPQFTIVSESDMSDWESNRQKKLLNVQVNTRLAALNLLIILIRNSEKHVIFGYWWCLLPEENVNAPCGLTALVRNEKNTGVKTAGLTVITNLLTACRPYLSAAEASKRSVTSFTPFSVSLGQTLTELHTFLTRIVSQERRVPTLVSALKCLVACIQATPYQKLGGQILVPVVESAKRLLSGDWTVQVAALIVMGCVISLEPPMVEIINVFSKKSSAEANLQSQNVKKDAVDGKCSTDYLDEDSDEFVEDIFEEDEGKESLSNLEEDVSVKETEVLEVSQEEIDRMSWLLEICLRNLGWTFKNGFMERSRLALVTVRQESLQVISAMAIKSFNSLLAPHFKIISRMFLTVLRDPFPDMLLHATKCLQSIGEALQTTDETSVLALEDSVVFWTMMLRGPLTEVLQSDQVAPARAVACDCISSIGERTYTKLPANLKILCATLLLGSSGDENVLVRTASVRALSVCIMYKEWREDPCLMGDCGESILRVLNETTLAVKVKAMWALANITDALFLNLEDPNNEPIDILLLTRILQESIVPSKENYKIKMNSMRSLGNIMLLVNEDNLKENVQLRKLAECGLDQLVQCALHGNNMKVRWNACHALGKAMKNHTLFSLFKKWQMSVFSCLCDLMEKCRNLKVRSQAVMALRSPTSRDLYGDNFCTIWKAVLVSMENTLHTEDFTEYKHKDHLVEQLCVTLSHLACLLTSEDLLDITDTTIFMWEPASQLVKQVAQRVEPEGETCCKLLEAAKYVTTQLSIQTDCQKECLNIIQNLFIWET